MARLRLLLAALLIALAALAVACGDDDGGSSATPTESATATESPATGDQTPANGDDGDDDGETTPPDEKTPVSTEDGSSGETPGPTTNPTPASAGIPAIYDPDYSDWLAENFPGVSPDEGDCIYSPATVIATCGGVDYAVDPPLGGEDISCFTQVINSEPVAIRCTSQSPLTTIYYVIQG